MWNDTDIPLAILFTFRCYGTWLHGDERGSVDRHNNIYDTPRIPVNQSWEEFNKEQLDHPSVKLNGRMRRSVKTGIEAICQKQGWELAALNVRTNHVHAVISIGVYSAERALAAIKAASTRRMREDGSWKFDHTPWAEKGSKRKLWNEKSVADAIYYVFNWQGDELPDL